jgi:DNA gyrase subunit A
MEIGLVQRINIDDEMQQAYLDYAMSVIVARALPDARDGLKPVHRRILYAMHDMGIRPDTPYKKSARIVGEVLGKYHPHGDMAVYEAMARMAQDFSMRYKLVDGQGNFGSVDGDAPAAMRYTEARLALPAARILADIQKNTVDFDDNFDGTLTEPRVLPAAIPNLLVNGATGIAVGMATSIPPHNLGEVVDAIHYMLENWEKQDDLTVEDLMNFVQGPDFPTGGIIVQEEASDGLVSAYSTGRGRVTVRASAHLEEMERGRNRIIINELPYMTNKSSLIERIAALAREERLEGIADLRDESDRQGMRIVIELTKTADPQVTLSELYKSTPMQSTFSIIMLALVDGEPRLLSLKQALRVFIGHRLEIVRRRSEYDLEKARQRAHILEGLLVALHNLDEIIALIRKSPDAETARERLVKRFKLTVIQAQAILDMPLRRLAALERKKIEDEYKEVKALIKELESLLRSPKKMRQVVDQELQEIKETFSDRRRTHIARLKHGESKVTLLTATDLKPEKMVWVSVSTDGLIARTLDETLPRWSGKDAPLLLCQANTRDTLYLVTDQGEAAALPVHALPEGDNAQAGLPVHRVSALNEGQRVAALFALPSKDRRPVGEEGYVLTVTRQGMLKKSSLADLPGPSAATFTLTRVNPQDSLAWLRLTGGQDELLLVTASGMAIRFHEEEVRPMGLVAAGVLGIKLQPDDQVAGIEIVLPHGELFLLASDGSAKRVPFDQFSRQGRYGQGLIAWRLPARVTVAGCAAGKGAARLVVHLAHLAPKTLRLDAAPLMTRTARGQVIQELKSGDPITALCPVPAAEKTGAGAKSPARIAETRASAPVEAAIRTTPKPAATTEKPAPKGKTAAAKIAPGKPAAAKESQAAARMPAKSAPATPSTTRKTTTAAEKPPTQKAPAKSAPATPSTTRKTTTAAEKTPTQKPPAKSAPATPSTTRKTTTAADIPPTQKPPAKAPAKRAPATPSTTRKTTPAAEKPPTQKPPAKAPAKSTTATPTTVKKTTTAEKPPTKKPASGSSTKSSSPTQKPTSPSGGSTAAPPATQKKSPAKKAGQG